MSGKLDKYRHLIKCELLVSQNTVLTGHEYPVQGSDGPETGWTQRGKG